MSHEIEPADSKDEIAQFIFDQLDQFSSNIHRSRMLVELYNTVAKDHPNSKTILSTDILRASVVFLHAALEELLRSLTIATFPTADAITLNDVPLIGHGRHSRAEKFLLGDLLKHKDKTISELINDCVTEYTSKLTYNNRGDLLIFARTLGLKESDFTEVMPKIEAMLHRRHQIVHRSDRPLKKDLQWVRATPLSPRHVEIWIDATMKFVSIVLAGACIKKYLSRKNNNPKINNRNNRNL